MIVSALTSFICPFQPYLEGLPMHYKSFFFWELCVSPRADKHFWPELHYGAASAQPCALLLPSFWKQPRICLLEMTLALPGLLAEQFLKQFPTWGFWFHENAVFLGNKLVFLHLLWKPGRQRPCKPAGTTVGEGLPAHLTGLHGCPAALLPT